LLQHVRAILLVLWVVTSPAIRTRDSVTVNLTSLHAIAASAEMVSISFLHLNHPARYASTCIRSLKQIRTELVTFFNSHDF